ncbi:MAG: hypothetical protein QXT73_05630, partial [Candidatus Methanomethylicaceae archaeon]
MGLYKQPNSSVWWMSFTCNGKQYRLSTKTRDRNLAMRIYHRVLRDVEEGRWFDRERDMTFDELVKEYRGEEDAKPYILQFVPVYLRHFGGRKLS